MIFAYIRISTDKQTVENQKFEILKFADQKKIHVEEWIEETISGTKKYQNRKLGKLLQSLKKEDILIVSELSRLGRNLIAYSGAFRPPVPEYSVQGNGTDRRWFYPISQTSYF
jgi:DNA invertase Pin-like site-specific DNA recombinase